MWRKAPHPARTADCAGPPVALHAIVVAAGCGTRAGDIPKQFAALAGRTVLWHALRPFAENKHIDSVRVVVTAETAETAAHCAEGLSRRAEIIPAGGATRAASVRGGLLGLPDDDWAIVHDAARPCLSDLMLARLLSATKNDEVGGLLALPLGDSLKEGEGKRARRTLSREKKYLAQTPQIFRAGILRAALQDDCDDESQAMENAGYAPLLISGDAANIKITFAEDFALAEAVLSARAKT